MPNDLSYCVMPPSSQAAKQSPQVKANTKATIALLEQENDLSELDYLDHLIETHTVLRKISQRIRDAASEVRSLWDEAPPVSSQQLAVPLAHSVPSVDQAKQPLNLWHAEKMAPSVATATINSHATSPGATQISKISRMANPRLAPDNQPCDDVKDDLDQWIELLKVRGKGEYTCPVGTSCRRGAVKENGELVVFTQNSEFRAHVQKHSKPYKCNLPNCPNRKGFSRVDQLRRHQTSVPHSRVS